jgi:N-acyl homoserine lactone hydrolase
MQLTCRSAPGSRAGPGSTSRFVATPEHQEVDMIPTYTVHAVRLGTIRMDKSSPVHGYPPGTTVDIPVWAAAVEGNGRKLLVDTGIKNAEKWSKTDPHTVTAEQTIDAALAELGWRPKDVDLVVNTHLHYDHVENNPSLSNAQFFVSRAEWEFAADPGNAQAWAYSADWTGPDLTYMNYTLIDADHYDVLPGIRVVQTPGHTPGHQSVVINTSEGLLCVTGDAACMMENLTIPTPPGVHVSSREALSSIKKICTLADRVLMNHDPQIKGFQSSGFPISPAVG